MEKIPCPKCQTPLPPGSFCPTDGARVPKASEFGPGFYVGDYEVKKRIGKGGMGEVWLAEQPDIAKRVAIKRLSKHLAEDPQAVERFKREARAVNEIKSRHLVDIFSFGTLPDGCPYFVMEFLEGKPLSAYLKEKGVLPFSEILDLFSQLCSALQAAHERGIIHRDLKPDNIFLVPEGHKKFFVKILDFGIAKLMEEENQITRTRAIFGTPAYMSPEQCGSAKNVDHRTDIYALGIILFETVCGQTPFSQSGDSVPAILARHVSEPVPPLSQYTNRRLPPALDAFIRKALGKNPQERPQSCNAFYEQLVEAVGSFRDETDSTLSGAATLPPGEETKPTGGASSEADQGRPEKETGNAGYYIGTTSTGGELAGGGKGQPSRMWLGLAALLLLAGGGGYFAFLRPAPPQPEVVATRAPLSSPVTLPTPPPTLPTSEPTPEPPSLPAHPETVLLKIGSKPEGARVFLGEELLGVTPLEKEIPYGEKELTLRIEKEGFLREEILFTPDEPFHASPVLIKQKTGKNTGKGGNTWGGKGGSSIIDR